MQRSIERITGDSDGVVYEFPVYRVKGSGSGAPSAYLQAAIHAGELPGAVAIHALMPMLRKAEAEGRIRGDVTIVPQANPIGRAQYLFGELLVKVGPHLLTVQMDISRGKTFDSLKPTLLELGKAFAAKLR